MGAKAIGGVGLDVFDIEPLPTDHPLRSMENTVLTPHLGYVEVENYEMGFAINFSPDFDGPFEDGPGILMAP